MLLGVDHFISLAPDLDRAVAAARRLGFRLTDRGLHPGRGTANHLVMFPGAYWELLAVEEPMPANARYRAATRERFGLLGCALGTSDIVSAAQLLTPHSIAVGDRVDISRPVMVDGREEIARFQLADITPDAPFDGFFFFCDQRTPHLVWRREWLQHPNGATRIHAATIVADDPAAAADLMAAMTGPSTPAWRCLSPGDAAKLFSGHRFDPAARPRFAALTFEAPDIATLSSQLAQEGLQPRPCAEGIYVVCPELGDTVIGFTEPT